MFTRNRSKNLSSAAAKIDALDKSQAVIEFELDGTVLTANHNFLTVLGYTLAEIQGKHHRMFVEPAFAASSEYAQFWDRLRRGEYQAAQFKRIAKGGREIWIEASYNPILDANGRPYKVVKFATDITAQVELLNQLKTLIDRNFGEIGEALGRSDGQSGAVMDAATETSANVQTIAAAAEELASSTLEIATSMTKSRTMAEQAQQQAEAADQATQKMADAARQMNGIVELIRSIAGQINLLALNATIEAARAGEAGKGFAVVASEVKQLATQTSRATEDIQSQVSEIQSETAKAAEAVRGISTRIEELSGITASVSSAVEEQGAATQEIARNVQQASLGTQEVSATIGSVTAAANETGSAAAQVLASADGLATQSARLRNEAMQFLATIRVA